MQLQFSPEDWKIEYVCTEKWLLTNSYLLPLNLTEDHHFSFSVLNSNKWVSFGYRWETKMKMASDR